LKEKIRRFGGKREIREKLGGETYGIKRGSCLKASTGKNSEKNQRKKSILKKPGNVTGMIRQILNAVRGEEEELQTQKEKQRTGIRRGR